MGFFHQFWQLTVDGLSTGSLYAVIALGYTLVYGVLQLINFAHSEVFMFGAFAGLFAVRGRRARRRAVGWPRSGSSLFGLIVGALAGAARRPSSSSAPPTPAAPPGAPKLAYLISAIGASVLRVRTWPARSSGRQNVNAPEPLHSRHGAVPRLQRQGPTSRRC